MMPVTAFELGRLAPPSIDGRPVPESFDAWCVLALPANLAGLPAINVPARRTPHGLPVGATLVGDEGGEEIIARIAMRWESVSGYTPSYPQLPAADG